MNHRMPRALALLLPILLATASSASGRQEREMTSYSPPPPGRTSTGGKPTAPPSDFAKARGVLKVRGTEIKTKDALYPGQPALVGLAPAEVHASLGLEVRPKKLETANQEEMRRRTLSLYGDRSDPAAAGRGKSASTGRGGAAEGSGNAFVGWLLGGMAIAALAGWRIHKLRKLPVTN